MTLQVIGIGASADDGTGDTLRAGGDKINDNFGEIYAFLAGSSAEGASIGAATARASLGLATSDSPTFAGLTLTGSTQSQLTLSDTVSSPAIIGQYNGNTRARLSFGSGGGGGIAVTLGLGGGANTGEFLIQAGTQTGDRNALRVTGTWSDAAQVFTLIKANATSSASAALSRLLDLQLGGVSMFRAEKSGNVVAQGEYLTGEPNHYSRFNSNGMKVHATGGVQWSSSGDSIGTTDLYLLRDAANTLAQRNSTNAQALRVYNTYTDASNYERGGLKWSGNQLELFSESAGTGAARGIWIHPPTNAWVYLGTAGGYWGVNPSGHLLAASGDNAIDIGASGATRPRTGYFGTDVVVGGAFKRGSDQVVGARVTGWAAPTGTLDRTTFDESTVTLPQLAQRVAALVTDLRTHGLINN